MISLIWKVICLILFGIHLSYTFECDGSSKAMHKATDIQSNELHDYLGYINCSNDNRYGNANWQAYVAECFKNSSCVGIRSNTPRGICTLSNNLQTDPVEIEGLWLIIEELERFVGMTNSEINAILKMYIYIYFSYMNIQLLTYLEYIDISNEVTVQL